MWGDAGRATRGGGAVGERLMRIGEVSERTGLSLRTMRHYENVGVVAPSGRTLGGFRLYTESEAHRLVLVRRMRPLGFSLGDVRAPRCAGPTSRPRWSAAG